MSRKEPTTKGVCLLGCKKSTISAKQSLEHLQICDALVAHLASTDTTPGFFIRVQCAYRRNVYWLMLAVPGTSTLNDLDLFLRDLWLECCGHLSSFSLPGSSKKATFKISQLKVGDKFSYEYDFGDTSKLILQVEKAMACPTNHKITLLIRNNKPEYACENCCPGKKRKVEIIPATTWCDNRLICDSCKRSIKDREARHTAKATTSLTHSTDKSEGDVKDETKDGDEDKEEPWDYEEGMYDYHAFRTLVNSPRTGCCGYTGNRRVNVDAAVEDEGNMGDDYDDF